MGAGAPDDTLRLRLPALPQAAPQHLLPPSTCCVLTCLSPDSALQEFVGAGWG